MRFTPSHLPWQVLCGQEELAEQVGALLWPQLAAAYIQAKLRPIAPQSDAEVRPRRLPPSCAQLQAPPLCRPVGSYPAAARQRLAGLAPTALRRRHSALPRTARVELHSRRSAP